MRKHNNLTVPGMFFVICLVTVMLSGCAAAGGEIDVNAMKQIIGEYQAVEETDSADPENYIGSWWHLSISNENGAYLSIYDNEAGNPEIEGPVTVLDGESITVEYDPDYYDELPSGKWNTEGENLIVNYELTEDGIVLENSGRKVRFVRE